MFLQALASASEYKVFSQLEQHVQNDNVNRVAMQGRNIKLAPQIDSHLLLFSLSTYIYFEQINCVGGVWDAKRAMSSCPAFLLLPTQSLMHLGNRFSNKHGSTLTVHNGPNSEKKCNLGNHCNARGNWATTTHFPIFGPCKCTYKSAIYFKCPTIKSIFANSKWKKKEIKKFLVIC